MAHGEIEIDRSQLSDDSLIELSNFKAKSSTKESIAIKIALFSDSEDIKKLNYYLFSGVDGIDYNTIDKLSKYDLDDVDEMDIIVFNKDDETLKEMLLDNIKLKSLPTKFFLISNKSYLRQKDILKEHVNGVDQLLKLDFFLEDYILSMERYLKNNFYSSRLLELKDDSKVILNSKDSFEKEIRDLIEQRIFFSLFNFKYDSEIDIDSYNIRKIVREHDTIYIDKESKEITFLLLNITPEFGSQMIKKRINNFSIILKEINKLSSFDIVYEK